MSVEDQSKYEEDSNVNVSMLM